MSNRLSKFALTFLLLGTGAAEAAVWQESQSWNSDWEQKYSDWVRDSFNEEIYVSGNYKGIPTDCADAVYLARIIFSYENKLPFVIKDSTGGSNRITNQMSRFDSTSDSLQRVRKFMDYVGDVTSTKTLPNDTYPVKVTRDYVRAGTVWSRPRITKDNWWRRLIGKPVQEDPGHAELVKEVSDTGVVNLIGSTVPKEIRKLISTSSLVFMPIETSTGFRNWMLPSYYSQSKENLPGYSLEQFNEMGRSDNGARDIRDWTTDAQNRLALREESKGESIVRQIKNLCSLVNARVDTILKAEARREKLGGACMDASDYDSYSTPSRDKRLKLTLEQLIDVGGGNGFTKAQRIKALKANFDACPAINIGKNYTITLYNFSVELLKGNVSSNPNDSFLARWGLDEPSNSNCPKYE